MQIPILNGIYTDNGPDFRTSYPVNMVPVPKGQGISSGYLRPAEGIVEFANGPGEDRGGINWNGECFRVMGPNLVRISRTGIVTDLGIVGGTGVVKFDYSADRLAIASGGKLYYWDGGLTQVTDADLGTVIDFCWVDGYFFTTDGTHLVVTELSDPLQVNPLKYGSSEADPDPIKAVLKLRNEVYALNRHTIEVFDNVGGELFPFQRVEGAQIQKGVIGTAACCVFADTIAFLGSGRNETPAIYLGSNATTTKISTHEIDAIISEHNEATLSQVKLEARTEKTHLFLYVHLPDRTLVFDASASKELGEHVWFTLTSSMAGFETYRARNFVWCYDNWIVGDPTSSAVGYLDDGISTHFGKNVRWEFGTTILYNEGNGAIFNELELVALTGRVAFGENPAISTSYSLDGETWSQDKPIRVGSMGDRLRRLVWFQQGSMRNWRIQRFRGDSQAHLAFARLEARMEPLAY